MDFSILIGSSTINHPFGGTPIDGNLQLLIANLQLLIAYGFQHTSCVALLAGVDQAQFGDFANCAQPIIDNFIASGEQKSGPWWNSGKPTLDDHFQSKKALKSNNSHDCGDISELFAQGNRPMVKIRVSRNSWIVDLMEIPIYIYIYTYIYAVIVVHK